MARSKKRRARSNRRKPVPRTPTGQPSRSAERRLIEHAQAEQETQRSLAELFYDRARGLGITPEQSRHPASETIAGRMALRGVLTFSQAAAIEQYARLVARVASIWAVPRGSRCSLDLSRGGTDCDVDQETYDLILRRYNDAFVAVREVGVRACRAVNLVVRDFCEVPISEREAARQGAAALVRHFGLEEARAA